ncbi:MAG: hypothetical protein EOO43_05870 [Flavobacterium sp.]|nr:MAG: hypothetical protein EOO43_05870 [Flavobacterium sp.]
MKIAFVAPIEHFKLENPDTIIESNGLKIMHGSKAFPLIQEHEAFCDALGIITLRTIQTSYVTYYEGDNIFDSTIYDTPGKICERIVNSLFSMFNGLWYVKDCSVFISAGYTHICGTEKTASCSKPTITSDSLSTFKSVVFTEEEIVKAISIFNKTHPYLVVEENNITPAKLSDGGIAGYENEVRTSDNSRIGRGLMFLYNVRSNSNLPYRIAFSVAILECLFTSSNGELTHQVSERSAFYLGGPSSEKQSNYDLVKSCYGVRSKFVHGDRIKNKREDLLVLSSKMDSFLRSVLIKAINAPDVFILSDSEGDKKKFENHFKNLLFN